MNIDLSSAGTAFPLIAAAIAALLTWYMSGKKTDTAAGPLAKLQGIFESYSKWLPVALAIYSHRNDLLSYLQAFAKNNFQFPDEKKT